MRRARRIAFALIFLVAALLVCGQKAHGQMMPGMEQADKSSESKAPQRQAEAGEATTKPRTAEEKKEAAERQIEQEQPGVFRKLYIRYLGEYSPYRGLILAVLTVIVLLALRRYTTRLVREYAHPKVQKPENLERFLKTWKSVWKFVIAVFVVIALSGSLKILGLSAAFLGMMLGWSLQAPVTGIAAWLMIVLKRPFKIGDRIIIGGIIGDVMDVTLTHVILN